MDDQYTHLLNVVHSLIKPCDLDKPYIFISYSSEDRDTVWGDVLKFQQDGYNVWLDEQNLEKTQPSWRNDALQAIRSQNCKLLLFYASRNSLLSEACLRELRASDKKNTLIVIEAEPIDDIAKFCDELWQRLIKDSQLNAEPSTKMQTLLHFKEEFFPDNERVRIRAWNSPNWIMNYYEEIQKAFQRESSLLRLDKPAKTQPKVPEVSTAPETVELRTTKTLSSSDLTYSICTLGTAFHLGFGVPVTVELDGKEYLRRTHKTVKGRIDGMKQVYGDHGLRIGDVLKVWYEAGTNTIHLHKV